MMPLKSNAPTAVLHLVPFVALLIGLANPGQTLALDWVQFSASGGPSLVGVGVGSYGTADGHSESADLSAGGRIGEADYYPLTPDVVFFGTVGVRYLVPARAPLGRWGIYADFSDYLYIEGSIPTVSLGIARLLW